MKKNNYEIDDQKRIGRREFLEIEDKGMTEAEKLAAAAAVEDETIAQPVRKKTWAGWWAAALALLAVVGCFIYYSTKDSRQLERRTAQIYERNGKVSNKAASFAGNISEAASTVSDKVSDAASDVYGKVSDATSEAYDKVADAAANVSGKVSDAATAVKDKVGDAASATADAVKNLAGVDVYAKYPVATDKLISQEAADGRKVDYLYYFANNQSAIPDNEVLNEIAEAAKETDAQITITAYASPTGSAAYNEALCEKRAENLENYLVAHGVDADNINIEKGGQTAQFGDEAFNRRADILVNYAG